MDGLKIALDYDGTYTADPVLFDLFVEAAHQLGHQVTIVTMRYPHEEIRHAPCEVVYTSRKAKSTVFQADIWIDDKPHWLLNDALG